MNTALQTLKERGFYAQCTDPESLSRAMDAGPIALYVGIDPTGGSLHIGHLVPLYALVHLARAGHEPIALVGGGTARIGDPSGKSESRRLLDLEQIEANVVSITRQIEAFVNGCGVSAKLLNNADWLANLNYIDFLRDIGRHFSVNRMLSFEAYKARLETGLSFIEFNYQLLQSFDFLELHRRHGVTLQIGGDDQWGNIVSGADLIRRVEGAAAYGLTFPLITRSDGQKMGKTESGAVYLDPALVSPYEMYQYWRNVTDADVRRLLLTYTFLPADECDRLASLSGSRVNEAKERLAFEATALIHGADSARVAQEAARSVFASEEGSAEGIPEMSIAAADLAAGIGAVELFARTRLCASRSEARRLLEQGGARINDRVIDDVDAVIDASWTTGGQLLLRAGKKRYFRVLVT